MAHARSADAGRLVFAGCLLLAVTVTGGAAQTGEGLTTAPQKPIDTSLRKDALRAIEIGLDCSTYDVLVVDELGAECELLGLDVCFDDAVWVIDNAQLAACDF